MSQDAQAGTEKMIFRNTHAQTGRHVRVSPQNSTMRHLSYARIVLNPSCPGVTFSNGPQETGLICLSGRACVKAAEKEFVLERYDSIYIPRDSAIEVSASGAADLAEFSCDVTRRYPLKLVPYSELEKEAGLKFITGGPGK